MSKLEKEIWINQVLENFYPDSTFLNYVKDYSTYVEYDALNLAQAGVDPKVLVDNKTYPIKMSTRADEPVRIELNKFETENTIVRRPEVIQYAYDQLESVLSGHRNTLRSSTATKAAHAFAPDKHSADTPVLKTTGAEYNGRKMLSFEDILNLKEAFDNLNIPLEDRFLVLHPSHVTDLIRLDVKSFKDLTDVQEGKPKRFAGFGILQFSNPAFYDLSTLEKKAFEDNTGAFCSFAFHKEEVMKADGELHMYVRENDPEERGTIVGFDKRFIALPLRNKGIGAIVSDKA